jgi:hypothetical protein
MYILANTKTIFGIAATMCLWQYANEGIDYMSKQLDRLIKTTNIPDDLTSWCDNNFLSVHRSSRTNISMIRYLSKYYCIKRLNIA